MSRTPCPELQTIYEQAANFLIFANLCNSLQKFRLFEKKRVFHVEHLCAAAERAAFPAQRPASSMRVLTCQEQLALFPAGYLLRHCREGGHPHRVKRGSLRAGGWRKRRQWLKGVPRGTPRRSLNAGVAPARGRSSMNECDALENAAQSRLAGCEYEGMRRGTLPNLPLTASLIRV